MCSVHVFKEVYDTFLALIGFGLTGILNGYASFTYCTRTRCSDTLTLNKL